VHFQLTEDQLMVQKTAREFAEAEVLPKAAEIDREHRHPKELVARMAELGFLGVAVPEQYGGSGLDHVSYAVIMEEVSRACASTGVIMSVNNSLVCDPINRFGTEAQKQKWLTPLAQGKLLGCFALSEPEAGSDAAAQRTTAVRDSDGSWIISGTKNWITNGPVADACVLFTMNDRAAGHKGITAFILPMDAPGVRCGTPDDKLGIRGSKSSQIFLDDVRLPAEALLGEVGGGFKVAMSTLDGGRIGIAAQALGIARACLDDSVGYAQTRKTFGKPIGQHQAIGFKLADMATEIDAARGVAQGPEAVVRQGGRHGQAVRVGRRQPRRARGDPDLRRKRVRDRVPGRATLPRRQDHRDLRGHQRDPAPGHRRGADERGEGQERVARLRRAA
jgi:butyryl-CoA dehydrogenase